MGIKAVAETTSLIAKTATSDTRSNFEWTKVGWTNVPILRRGEVYVKVIGAFVAHEFLLTHSFKLHGNRVRLFLCQVDANEVRTAFRKS